MNKFKQIETTSMQKLKYEGFCFKCKKVTFHRFNGGTIYRNDYRCMKCKTINSEQIPFISPLS